MKLLKRMLVTCALTVAFPYCVKAQNGNRMISPLPGIENIYDDNCKKCDSLGDEYLATGDSSMALYYYQLFFEANPHDENAKKTAIKFRRLYTDRSSSFYLKEY